MLDAFERALEIVFAGVQKLALDHRPVGFDVERAAFDIGFLDAAFFERAGIEGPSVDLEMLVRMAWRQIIHRIARGHGRWYIKGVLLRSIQLCFKVCRER